MFFFVPAIITNQAVAGQVSPEPQALQASFAREAELPVTIVAQNSGPSVTSTSGTPEARPDAAVRSYPARFFAAAQPNTARDMIDRVPGFTFDDGASARGFDAAAGNVLIDGQLPASKSDTLESVLRRIPTSQVARIDVIRGGASGIDMHGEVLVANVIRQQATATSGNIQINDRWVTSDGQQAPNIRIEGSHQAGGRTLEGSLSYARFIDQGLGAGKIVDTVPTGDGRSVASDNALGGGSQASATGAFSTPLAGGKFRVNLSVQRQAYGSDEVVGNGGRDAITAFREHDAQTTTMTEIGLHYDRDLGRKLSLEALALQQLDANTASTLYDATGDSERFCARYRNGESIGRIALTWRPSAILTVESGAEGAYNWLSSRSRYIANGMPVMLPAANVWVAETRGEAFVKTTWAPSAKINLEAGLREEMSHITSEGDGRLRKTLQYLKPGLVVAWTPETRDQLRLRLAKEVSQLDFNDFVASASFSTGQVLAGNPNLVPQQSWIVEAAFERRLLGDGAATIKVRHSVLDDVIDRAPVRSPAGLFDTPANIGNGHKDEIIADLSFPLTWVGIGGGLLKTDLTWRHSSVRDPTTGQQRPISGLRPFEGTIDFSQDLPRHKITWGAQLNVGWSQTYYRFDQIETDSLPVRGLLYWEARPRRRWSIRGEIPDIGGGSGRALENWPDLRMHGSSYEDRYMRSLGFGPLLRVRIRKDV